MAEEEYPEYKEVQGPAITTPRRLPFRLAVRPGGGVRIVRYRSPKPQADYAEYKTTLAAVAEEIKIEIRAQHQQTRAEVQTVKHDVLAAIKASPVEYLKLLCEFGSLFLLFSLAIRFLLKIELVNTGFALFMLAALVIYWAMVRVKESSDKRRRQNTQG